MIGCCPTCHTQLPLARVGWRARKTLRGLMLRETTGVICPGCGDRWVIVQVGPVVVGLSSFFIGIAAAWVLIRLQNVLHHPLRDPQILLAILLLLVPLVFWQNRIVPLFSGLRPVGKGESVHFPLSPH
jgi:hypothetical protein